MVPGLIEILEEVQDQINSWNIIHKLATLIFLMAQIEFHVSVHAL